jgi:peroxiredoxin
VSSNVLALAIAIVGLVLIVSVYQLVLQNGRILLRLETLERALTELRVSGGRPESLPSGSVLHDFELPLPAGGSMTLSQWRGQRLLLVFFDPACGYCQRLAPSLAGTLPLTTLIISTGDREENRALFAAHSVTIPVLVQQSSEVAELYRISGTPSGYLVDEHGATAGELLVGATALLAAMKDSAAANGTSHKKAIRSTRESQLIRNGLKAGTRAPDFILPQLDGEELSLSSFYGQNILLVFSDPACAPCMALAPKLEQIHRSSSDLRVLMISRGDVQANRDKVEQLGLTFPVVLQRHWEISRVYGKFATPIAYLIGGDGLLVSDVAVGQTEILGLVSKIMEEEKTYEQTV